MGTKTDDGRLWQAPMVREFVKQAKSRVGDLGWNYLSIEQREGLIAKQFASVLLGNARHDIPGKAIQMLYRDMLEVAGLLEAA